jgi:hypothetical protein
MICFSQKNAKERIWYGIAVLCSVFYIHCGQPAMEHKMFPNLFCALEKEWSRVALSVATSTSRTSPAEQLCCTSSSMVVLSNANRESLRCCAIQHLKSGLSEELHYCSRQGAGFELPVHAKYYNIMYVYDES